jgi:ribose 5-phosphate isomerase A
VDIQTLKKRAAERAVEFIDSGMVVGLGHGSTAIFAVRKIAELIKRGELTHIVAIPCSKEIETDAIQLGIPLTTFEAHPIIDLTIDGADEVDPHLNVIKGGGGALLREKIVAQASRREIIVVDETKLSDALGTHFAVPVEVIPFGWQSQISYLEQLGAMWTYRLNIDGTPFFTDQGNLILDCKFGAIANPFDLAAKLNELAIVVGHGLFLNLVTDVIVASEDGIQHHQRS